MPHRILRSLVVAVASSCLSLPAAAAPAPDEAFSRFVAALWPDAQAAGVGRPTFDAAFAGLAVDPAVIRLARAQPEFNQTIGSYVRQRVTEARVQQGRALAARWKSVLDRIEAETGVDRFVVLAIWGMESNFGASGGSSDTVRSLATLACCTQRRPQDARADLIAALQILQKHDIAPRAMLGSWAGALGQTQFTPRSFLLYAVDADGDGRRDIWTSTPDALASIAGYLRGHDWQPSARWGYEVRLPAGFDFSAITRREGKPAAQWTALGLAPADGTAPLGRDSAWLLLPAGAKGPAFLTFANYWTIKTYNISDAYTLSVGLLADRIRGGGPPAVPWPRDDALPRPAQLAAMQRRLVALGFPVDKIDGKVGPGTRAAIRGWQASVGLTADGYPRLPELKRMGALD